MQVISELSKFFRMGKRVSLGGAVTTVTSVQYLNYLMPTLLYVSVVGLGISIVFAIIDNGREKPILNIFSKESLRNFFWGGAIAVFLGLTICSALAMWAAQNGASTIAEQVYDTLVQDVSKIADNTDKIQKNTEQLVDNTTGLKKEISDNPRKELANRGVEWSEWGYISQVEISDLENLTLFYEGGFDPYTVRFLGRMPGDYPHNIQNSTELNIIKPMAVIAFNLITPTHSLEPVKLAYKYGYALSNDSGFLFNFTHSLDVIEKTQKLSEEQIRKVFSELKTFDENVLLKLKDEHGKILESLQNDTYQFVSSVFQYEMMNLQRNLDYAKESLQDNVQSYEIEMNKQRPHNNMLALFKERIIEGKNKITMLNNAIVDLKNNTKAEKIKYHKKYIEMIDALI